ncbi:hypothetical protein [Pseudonocardia sp.]|uniref:hypothetical protein n=1 Tax=Pseudonocardia sp. TaxID=60912 RepID=UPI003D0EB4F0
MTFDEAVFDEVAAVADAVLFEGYLLYPYRASAQKNVLRWQFGVLTPDDDPSEPSRNRTECLLEPGSASVLRLRLRFLRLELRQPCGPDGAPVPELTVDGLRHLAFEEGIPVHVDAELPLTELLAGGCTVPVALPATEIVEDLDTVRLVRTTWEIRGRVLVSLSDLPGPYLVHRLRFDVVNDGACPPRAPRAEVLRTSLIAAHTVVHAPGAAFVSPVDHPRWAEPMVRECTCEHTWPVLAGPEGRADLLLSSPIILHDHPQIAPESPTNLFDGLENDEILTLRTLTLTDAEKAEARATDPRAAGIIDSIEEMPPEILERLHGAIRSLRPAARADEIPTWGTSRPFGDAIGGGIGADSPEVAPPESTPWWDPGADASVDPDTDSVLVAGVAVAKGSRVVLRPRRSGSHGTDAQDRFLDGLTATVHAVVHDVDGGVHVAVSVDGDPAAELQLAHGRFRYFRPDELEPAP